MVGMDLQSLASRTDIDIPYKVMERLKKCLPYSSEFAENRIMGNKVGSDKHTFQQNSRIDLFHKDR